MSPSSLTDYFHLTQKVIGHFIYVYMYSNKTKTLSNDQMQVQAGGICLKVSAMRLYSCCRLGGGAAFPQHSLYRLGALRGLYNDTTFYYHFIINGIYMAIGCWSIKRGIAVNSIGHSLIKYSFLIFWLISSQLILKICCLFLSYRDFISLKFYVLKHWGTIT